ncbi:EAL domain-containing protein [Limnobacter humi]|uniref:EAL domain-containing protein n=1 Tax=Limnobacter humi TaxID=1778671 RepID=A0ABT1WIA2_9BURK|nr:EAL domain-containing protein [Limnobacter humi]MCQ8896139.1 EAL domain-containing protein [Limnobacter humi]
MAHPFTSQHAHEPTQRGGYLRWQLLRSLLQNQMPAGLTLAWQPLLCRHAASGGLHAEALLRFWEPGQGSIGQFSQADAVLQICQQLGKMAFLDNWVMTRCVEHLEQHAEALLGLKTLCVNISPQSLNQAAFLDDSLALIRAHPRAASKLCLEITELGAVSNLNAVQRFVSRCRQLGVRIALDDFGSGYSNLRYVIDLQLDMIKIDGAIVRTMCHNRASRAVVSAISQLSANLGYLCVAEWVENLETLRALNALPVDCIQGYLVSEPVDPARFLHRQTMHDLVFSERPLPVEWMQS